MLLFKLISFLTGYVTVIIHGASPEKLINMTSGKGIILWNIHWISENKLKVSLRIKGVRLLRHIARECGCRFYISGKYGMPFFISKMRRRKTMVAGAVLFIFLLYMLSSFVWFIDVEGNVKLKDTEVMEAAREAGLYRGALKWSLSPKELSNTLQKSLPDVAWVGIHVNGTRVVIEVVEKILPPPEADDRPAHVVAKKEGLVQEILVIQGVSLVEEGQAVRKGEVLISGEISPSEENAEDENEEIQQEEESQTSYVHAQGIVRARVWYEGYGESEFVEVETKKTGNEVTRVLMELGDNEIILMGPRNIAFDKYDKDVTIKRVPEWRNVSIPVELKIENFFELESVTKKRTLHEAREIALDKAINDAKENFPPEVEILDEKIHEVSTGQNDNVLRVKVLIETLEEIGTEKLFKP